MKHTPLHSDHVALGAKMVEFGGWDMPVYYRGILEEHAAVRQRAGLFDVSHMGEIRVRGAAAGEFVQGLVTNDVAKLSDGRVHYTGMLYPEGGFVDDLLVYRLVADDYLLVVNAGNIDKDFAWIREHAGPGVTVADESPQWSQLALQGPLAEKILAPHCGADLAKLGSYWAVRTRVFGEECLVSRTGYTGEDGFELYASPEAGRKIWNAALEAGAAAGLVPCGLGARDTLRLEARLALYGNDIDENTTPIEAGLGWTVKMDKGEFIGRQRLARQLEQGVDRRLVGFEMLERGIARHGHPVFLDGEEAGAVTSGSYSPTLEKPIGLAMLPARRSAIGERFQIRVRGKEIAAVVVPTPFYQRRKRQDDVK